MAADDDFDWSAFRAHMLAAGKARRAGNRENSAAILTAAGVAFESKNGGAHLVVRHDDRVADFWPGTGLYAPRGGNKRGRGVFNLLRWLRVPPPAVSITPKEGSHD